MRISKPGLAKFGRPVANSRLTSRQISSACVSLRRRAENAIGASIPRNFEGVSDADLWLGVLEVDESADPFAGVNDLGHLEPRGVTG